MNYSELPPLPLDRSLLDVHAMLRPPPAAGHWTLAATPRGNHNVL